jgi:photosynthetic reaction center cytochrome c subunit
MIVTTLRGLAALSVGAALLLTGCERPPAKYTQQGFRGTAMQQVENPRTLAAAQAALPAVPADTPPAGPDGPKAKDVYQNVKVLGHLPVAEFNRHMNAITQWVAPEQGCTYCHAGANFADDSKYTKVVARRMIEMTQSLNSDWKAHTGATGVTCYTCHRGQAVPSQVWYQPLVPKMNKNTMIGNDFGQNKAMATVGLTSLPYDPYSSYLQGAEEIKVYGAKPLPQGIGKGATIQHAEKTYALMMHMSKSLGQNCTFCHNSQAFSQWIPKRVTAWHGIRMERDLNKAYLEPLTPQFPANRLGPNGDVAKVYCATCHQGVNKPLGGLEMAKLYEGLQGLPKGAPLPAPLAEAMRSVLYFGVGSAALAGEQAKGLEQLLTAMAAKPDSVVLVSGYHSAAGELAANQELAKQRAFAVRDALLAAGIAAPRVKLDKPQQTEANLAGEDPSARRVEVKLQ